MGKMQCFDKECKAVDYSYPVDVGVLVSAQLNKVISVCSVCYNTHSNTVGSNRGIQTRSSHILPLDRVKMLQV